MTYSKLRAVQIRNYLQTGKKKKNSVWQLVYIFKKNLFEILQF